VKRTICCCILLAALAGCGEREASDDALPADTSAAGATVDTTTAAPAGGMKAGAAFNATQVKKGDKVGALEVAANKTQAAPQSRTGVAGSVEFKGEVQLSGSYRAHFDYPEVKEACFWVDIDDWSKLPRVQGDDRIKWFCFVNKDDAIHQLGALGTETRATIVVRDYTTNIAETDAFDTAKLVRVVKKGS
jgi:hypothetical protein